MRDALWLRYASFTFLALVLSAAYLRDEHSLDARQTIPDDFPAYYLAGKLALRGRAQPLYFPADQVFTIHDLMYPGTTPGSPWGEAAQSSGFGPTFHFITPPFTALLFEPLARLPWPRAYLIWRWLTGLAVVISIYVALRVAQPEPFLPMFAAFSAAALSFFPYLQTLWLGQIGGLILLAWALGVYFIFRKKPVASAFCFALGTLVKVTPILAAGLFALRRQWRWLIAYSAWSGLLLLFSVWRLGWQNHLDWIRNVYPVLSCGIPHLENRSLPGLLTALYFGRAPFNNFPSSVPPLLCGVNKAVAGLFYLGALYFFWKRNKSSSGLPYELLVLAMVALAVSPISWRHHFMLAILPLGYLWGVLPFSPQASSNFEIRVLTVVTLIFGVKAPESGAARVPLLSVVAVGLWVVAVLLLIWLSFRVYDRCAKGAGGAADVLEANR